MKNMSFLRARNCNLTYENDNAVFPFLWIKSAIQLQGSFQFSNFIWYSFEINPKSLAWCLCVCVWCESDYNIKIILAIWNRMSREI